MKRWQRFAWKCPLGVIIAAVIVMAVCIGLFRIFAPLVPGYRERVQIWVSQTLDRPVSIAGMSAQWGLSGPELTLNDVKLLSQDRERVVMAAREIRFGYTLGAILHAEFSRPNRIVLISPRLSLEHATDGSYGIVGLEGSLMPGREPTDWRRMAAETFAQSGKLLVRDGEVTFIDMRTPAAPLIFSQVRLNLENSANDHELSGRMQLPQALGQDLSFAVRVQGSGLKPEAWQWQAQFQGNALSLPNWLVYWPAHTGYFKSGQLDIRAALSGTGPRVDQVQAGLNAHQVTPADATSGFDEMTATLNWMRSGDGWSLSGHDVQLRSGLDTWPASQFQLTYARDQTNTDSWSGDASFLRMQDLVALSTWLPKDFSTDAVRLQRLSPRGDLSAVKFSAEHSGASWKRWSLSSGFERLGLQADGKIPGFSGLTGQLSADQDGGSLALSGANATATFPQLFRGPLAARTLSATLTFHRDVQGWHFDLQNLAAGNADVQRASAHGSLLLPADGGSPVIDLQATAENAEARSKSAYLPVGIMPKEVVQWLDSAIAGGQVPSATLILRGALKDFPYDQGQGLFDIRFHINQGVVGYAADWPAVKNLDADVEFKNQGLRVAVQHGTLLNDDISGATAEFADLRNGVLQIQGTARGSARNALQFLRGGPLQSRFGHLLDDLSATGSSDVTLNLRLPVEQPQQYKLDGQVELRNAGLTLASLPHWPVSELNGTLKLSERGISTNRLRGMFLGEPLSVNLRPDDRAERTLIAAAGGVRAAQLSAALPTPFKQALSGATAWRLTGALPNEPAENNSGLSLTLTSNLHGLGLNLPIPFGKPEAEALPLQVAVGMSKDQRLSVRLDYAQVANGIVSFADDGGTRKFDRGALQLGPGQASLPDAAGLMLRGRLAEFSLDKWKPFFSATHVNGQAALPEWLLGADLEVGDFSGFGQDIGKLQLQVARAASDWSLNISSRPIAGHIAWPYHPDVAHPIVADMQRVLLTRKPVAQRSGPPPKLDPREAPTLRLDVKQFRYNDTALDNLQVELASQPDGVILKTLSAANPTFNVHASGRWMLRSGGAEETNLEARLQSTDVKQTLQAFGFAPGISGDQGELTAQLSWPGGPLADILPMLNGKLYIKLRHGSLLELQPGAGRIFGLLSINALPRRLLLNFSDVLGQGFAYDSIEGNFTLTNGDAYTGDLTVSGPAAKIQMVGRTGLAKHDFDEAVVVLPSVGSTLPVLSALAGGLGVGAVVFLLTEIFKKPLSHAGETRYHLSGTWDNPKLVKIEPPKPATPKPR